MPQAATTPWGTASVVEEVALSQEAEGRSFSSLVQLLDAGGELLVRFAYSTDGRVRRGPVTLRPADVEALREGLRQAPRLARALGLRGRR